MKTLLTLLRKNMFTLAVVVSVLSAYFYPSVFTQWGDFKLTRLIVPLIQVIMFGMGTTLSVKDFTRVLTSPWPVLVGVFLQYSIMPLVGLGVVMLLGLEGELAVGVILIGSVAGGVASNVMAYVAHANVALSVTMTSISTLLGPVMTPLLMRVLAGRFVEIDVLEMALSILNMILVPILLGLVVHAVLARVFPNGNLWINRVLSWVSMVGICVILAVILGPAHQTVKEAGGVLIFAAVIHNALGFVLGYVCAKVLGVGLGRLAFQLGLRPSAETFIPESDCRTVAIEVGMQNGGMGTALAINVLKSPIVALAPNIFGIWMNISGSLLANWWGKRPPRGGVECSHGNTHKEVL